MIVVEEGVEIPDQEFFYSIKQEGNYDKDNTRKNQGA